MSDENKVYKPEVLEREYPEDNLSGANDQGAFNTTGGSSSSKNLTPSTNIESQLPIKRVAYETLSQSLNTLTKKILGSFGFGQAGALRIGTYEEGVSGDISLTPAGITARNSAGNTTFAIDADTGDASFRGTVQAADFVIADEDGLISLNNFKSGTVSASSLQTTTSTSYADVNSMSLVLPTLTRESTVLIVFTVQHKIASTNIASNFYGGLYFILNVDGVDDTTMLLAKEGFNDAGVPYHDQILYTTGTIHYLATLAAGSHTIKIRWAVANNTGTGQGSCERRTLSYTVLGG